MSDRLVQRSALLASDVYAKQTKPDVELYLDLPMNGYDMFDMAALPALAEYGYSFTSEALADPQATAWWSRPAAAKPARPPAVAQEI